MRLSIRFAATLLFIFRLCKATAVSGYANDQELAQPLQTRSTVARRFPIICSARLREIRQNSARGQDLFLAQKWIEAGGDNSE
jgi:hypothetical protein